MQCFLRIFRSYSGACFGTLRYRAIPHKERLANLHAICVQISLQSLFRIFPHASCVHIFRDISGKYSKIHKGFSPFFPSSLKKSDDASVAQSLCGIALKMHEKSLISAAFAEMRLLFCPEHVHTLWVSGCCRPWNLSWNRRRSSGRRQRPLRP